MRRVFFMLLLAACRVPSSYAIDQTQGGILLDTRWKHDLYTYALAHVKHSIWGLAHSERNYHLAVTLAEKEGFTVDKDVLFVSAFMHDIGAIEPFRIKELEHSKRSVQIVEPLLRSYGLPESKISKVRETILAHMYDADLVAQSNEAIVFHDADTLDFLGDIGMVRIVGLTDRHAWAPDLMGAFDTLRGWEKELPTKLISKSAKIEAVRRISEMNTFLNGLKTYSVGNSLL